MKSKHIAKLVLWILMTVFFVYVAFNGLIVNYNVVLDGAYNALLGIDLKGGIHAILTPEEGVSVTNEELDAAIAVIELRLDGKGIYDRSIMPDYENGRVIVEIPWSSGETDFNPQAITEEIGDMAKLTFTAVETDSTTGVVTPIGDVLVDGSNVKDAYVSRDTETSEYVVALEFDSQGTEDFKNATTALVGEQLGICLDGEVISAPTVQQALTDGKATISGSFTYDTASTLANQIKSGSLPFKMVVSDGELRSITPILGENALNVAMQAGLVALIVILLFMILYYRVPGVVAAIALVAHVAIQVLLMVWLEISLTLPGIAGIILSIGMSVDANVIVFERMKEEISKGKNVASTIKDGFKNALSAIVDGNITTILSAAVLYYFGTGSVKGFAVTFIIGIILNFITGVWMTRSMLLSVEKLHIFKSGWWYGAKALKAPKGKEEIQ